LPVLIAALFKLDSPFEINLPEKFDDFSFFFGSVKSRFKVYELFQST